MASFAPGTLRLVLIVLLPFGMGHFVSQTFRTINAVIGRDLIADLNLTAGDIGLLTAAYLVTFALFQVPLGVLLDRYGPRKVNCALLLVAAIGALLFAFGRDRDTLMAARALIGLGVSGCLMAALTAVTMWFPKERWPLMMGLVPAIGGLGAAMGTAPVEAALKLTDWRGVFMGLSAFTACISALIFIVVPEKAREARRVPVRQLFAELGAIYRHPMFLAMAPLIAFTYAMAIAVMGLWAGLWLRDVAGLPRETAAWILALNNIGMVVGFASIGVIGEIATRRGIGMNVLLVLGTSGFMLVQSLVVLKVDAGAAWVWFLYGFFSNLAIVGYPLLVGRLTPGSAGRGNTSLNMVGFGGAFLAQYAIGGIIDLFPRAPDGRYLPIAYDTAFGIFLTCEVLSLAWFVFAYRRAARAGATN